MNANSAPTLQKWLRNAQDVLAAADVSSARLDAQIIAAYVFGVDKGWLLAHPEHIIDSKAKKQLDSLLKRRAARQPMAYLTGQQEFYGRRFAVTPNVLIPRPETESIIEQLRSLTPTTGQQLCDVGTGSGAIAITATLEWPGLQVEACDISPAALNIAQRNARLLRAKLHFFSSDLLTKTHKAYDFITANLPYVDSAWQCSAETHYEPTIALFADDTGLALIKKLIAQTPQHLIKNGYLLLEADPRQHQAISTYAATHGLRLIKTDNFCIVFRNIGQV